MCTVSWIHDNDGYQLFFNRDEKRTRKKAMMPRLAVRDGVRFLAPVDGDFGGTWIATNEFGVSVCLLNGTNLTRSGGCQPRTARSRGLLLLDLISSSSVAAVVERIRQAELAAFAPLTLAFLETGKPTALVEWNGWQKTFVSQSDACFMLTSSSFDTEEVRKRRQQEFHGLSASGAPGDAALFITFHQSHSPHRSAYSVCMHRPDAETVSFSRVRVSPVQTNFFYTPAAPCESVPEMHLTLTHRSVLTLK
jgi:hypothetical protein